MSLSLPLALFASNNSTAAMSSSLLTPSSDTTSSTSSSTSRQQSVLLSNDDARRRQAGRLKKWDRDMIETHSRQVEEERSMELRPKRHQVGQSNHTWMLHRGIYGSAEAIAQSSGES